MLRWILDIREHFSLRGKYVSDWAVTASRSYEIH